MLRRCQQTSDQTDRIPSSTAARRVQAPAFEGRSHFRARAKGIVLECLHRDPAQRPTSRALVLALQGLLDAEAASGDGALNGASA
jgi:hypothetical protein